MAWTKTVGTKHTCGGPKFGKLSDGCPRCDELKAGAEPRTWGLKQAPIDYSKHDCKASHCGPVCTFGDW